MQQAALQSHCDIYNNMNRHGQRINSQLNTSECCPTYKSINGLQKAITESFYCITIPNQLSAHWLINQILSGDHWDDAICCPNQTKLKDLSWEAQKCIFPNYQCTPDNKARVYNFTPSYRSVDGLLICFHGCQLLNVNTYMCPSLH